MGLCLGYLPRLERLELGPFLDELDYFPGFSGVGNYSTEVQDMGSALHSLHRLEMVPFTEEPDNFPGVSDSGSCSAQVEDIRPLFVTLKRLELFGWSKLVSLPDQLQHATSLEELSIEQFDGLTELPGWIGNLSSLKVLKLNSCPNLTTLPPMEAMRNLIHLKELTVGNCLLLEKRCTRKSGSEWPKIAHILNKSAKVQISERALPARNMSFNQF